MWGQHGDIILVHGDNLLSEAIEYLTRSYFSHSALCAEPGKIVEMTVYGFQYRDNYYISDTRPYIVLRHKSFFPQNYMYPLYIKRIRLSIEKFKKNPPRYDYWEILSQALKIIFSRNKLLKNEGESFISLNILLAVSEKLICSALIDSIYEEAGIDLFPKRIPKHTTPADIASLATGKKPKLLVIYKSPAYKKLEQRINNN